jgi:iron complex outermembrane recepter protein
MNRKHLLSCISAVFLLTLPIAAEDSAELSVVVTADRMEKAETETGATVSVITAEDISASGVSSLVDLLEALPGVQFKSYSGPAEAQVSMGGFGENSYGRVVVLVDGRLKNNIDMRGLNWMSVPLESVERIEVLHGGGGVLYGSGAVGGVINIITKETDSPLEVEAGGSFGSFLTHKEYVSVGTSNALGSVRVGGSYYSTDGYRDRSTSNYAAANLSGSLYPTDLLRFRLDMDYNRNFYEMPGGLTEEQYEDDPTQAVNKEDESTEHEFGASLLGEYLIGDDLVLETLLGYSYKNMAPDMASYPAFYNRLYHTFDLQPKFTWSSRFRDLPITFVGGADIRSSTLNVQTYSDQDRDNQTDEADFTLLSGGGYLNSDIELSDNLGLNAGFRYDAAKIGAENDDGTVDDDKLHAGPAWSAGLRWNPTPVSKIYLRHERMFRYPFTDEQSTASGDTFLDDLEAEKGYLYEIGGFYRLPRNARVDFRAYLLDMQDEITYVGFFPTGQNENYEKTRRFGAEGILSLSPIRSIKLDGSYSYVLPTFLNGDDKGNQIPLVSNHEVEGGLTWYGPFNIEASGEVSYRSDYYEGGDSANDNDMIDGYYVLNAALRWRTSIASGDLMLSLSVNNLLDESYAQYVSWYYYPSTGRSVTVSGNYKM